MKVSMDGLRENIGNCFNELVASYNDGCENLDEELTDLRTFIAALYSVYHEEEEDFTDLGYLAKGLLEPKNKFR